MPEAQNIIICKDRHRTLVRWEDSNVYICQTCGRKFGIEDITEMIEAIRKELTPVSANEGDM